MTIEDALRTHATSSPYPLTVNARVWFAKAPERATTPYVVFYLISADPIHVHSGSPVTTIRREYQFSIYGPDQYEVAAIGNALRLLFDGYRGWMAGLSGKYVAACLLLPHTGQMWEPDTKLFNYSLRFLVTFYDV